MPIESILTDDKVGWAGLGEVEEIDIRGAHSLSVCLWVPGKFNQLLAREAWAIVHTRAEGERGTGSGIGGCLQDVRE